MYSRSRSLTLCFALDGLADHFRGPVVAAQAAQHAGARQAPIGHGVVGLQLQAPAEGALGFVVPEGMQQRVALVEPALDFGILGGDGEVGLADAGDGPRLLAGSGIEGLAVLRVSEPGEDAGIGLKGR